jgi:alpha-galactosidase
VKKKIVVIGAGSASFGLTTLAGILRNKDLYGCELCLVDIDQEGLHAIHSLALRINEEWKSGFHISSSTDRKEALPGADYIILAIATDRENRWKIDHDIAKEYGIMHYAENGGPGALFHTARNLAIIMPILKDIEALCPQATLLNFTNPVPRIACAVHRYSSIPIVGICHQLSFGYMMAGYILSKDLGISVPENYHFVWTDESAAVEREIVSQAKEKLDIVAAGINHFTWMLSVRTKTGENIYPLLKKRFLENKTQFEPLTRSMIEIFDYVPVSGDCHMCEYLPYTHNMWRDTWRKYNIQMYDLNRGQKNRKKLWDSIVQMGEGQAPVDSLMNAQTERAELIIGAMVSDSHAYEPAVNIPNKGSISNFPVGSIIEVPGVVGADGISGIEIGSLPEPIAEMCRRQIVIAELSVKAGVEGDSQAAIQALALDPMVDDPSLATTLFDRYWKAHREFLPQFE